MTMKKLNHFFMYAVVLVATTCFVSCSDDDDDLGGDVSKLYGLWEPTHAEGYERGGDEDDSWNYDLNASNDFDDYDRVELIDGNKYKLYEYRSGSWNISDSGTFAVKGNEIILDNDVENVGVITSISDSRMIIESTEKEIYGGVEYTYYEKVTYKRIN